MSNKLEGLSAEELVKLLDSLPADKKEAIKAVRKEQKKAKKAAAVVVEDYTKHLWFHKYVITKPKMKRSNTANNRDLMWFERHSIVTFSEELVGDVPKYKMMLTHNNVTKYEGTNFEANLFNLKLEYSTVTEDYTTIVESDEVTEEQEAEMNLLLTGESEQEIVKTVIRHKLKTAGNNLGNWIMSEFKYAEIPHNNIKMTATKLDNFKPMKLLLNAEVITSDMIKSTSEGVRTSFIKELQLPNAKEIGDDVLDVHNKSWPFRRIKTLSAPNLEKIGNGSFNGLELKVVDFPKLKYIGDNSLNNISYNVVQDVDGHKFQRSRYLDISFPALEHLGRNSIRTFNSINLPVIKYIGYNSLMGHSRNNDIILTLNGKEYKIVRYDGQSGIIKNEKEITTLGHDFKVVHVVEPIALLSGNPAYAEWKEAYKTAKEKHAAKAAELDGYHPYYGDRLPEIYYVVSDVMEKHWNGFSAVGAHGSTIKKAIEDVMTKIARVEDATAKLLKRDAEVVAEITKNKGVNPKDYRKITGACQYGVNNWMETHPELDFTKPIPLLTVLKAFKGREYGYNDFESFVTRNKLIDDKELAKVKKARQTN